MSGRPLFTPHNDAIDLDAYFARIGYDGPRTASLETLKELHRLHPQAIAFENLDPFLCRVPVRLDAAALMDKLVRDRRGGYCFEHNLLFGHVLSALGFDVAGLAARILWNQPESARPPRGHMLLKVSVDGDDFIADAGFGAMTMTAPLQLGSDRPQQTPHEDFRLIEERDTIRLEVRLGTEWRPVYRFDLHEQVLADYEITSHYLSTHPDSPFRARLIAARPAPEGRYALANNRLTIRDRSGRASHHRIESVAELRHVLQLFFLVHAPAGSAYDTALSAVLANEESDANIPSADAGKRSHQVPPVAQISNQPAFSLAGAVQSSSPAIF